MPRGHKSKLRAREKRRQNRAETQNLKSAEGANAEEEEAACSSSSVLGDAPSSSTGAGPLQASSSAPASTSAAAGVSWERSAGKAKGRVRKSRKSSEASAFTKRPGLSILFQKANKLVQYLLNQYKMKEPIKKSDMLKIVHKWYKKDFSEILGKTSEIMDLVYGLELKEVKPNGNFYILVDNQDDASDGSLSRVWRFPIRGLLMPILSMLYLEGYRASEEDLWEFLSVMGVQDGQNHFLFGEPRKIITEDLVQEEYLVYQQVPNSDPPRYEFLWGPRAHAETSKMKILKFLTTVSDNNPTAFPCYDEEASKDEEERAQAGAEAEPGAGSPSKAGGHCTATSSQDPHPQ